MFKIKGKSGEEIAVSELNTLDDDYFPDASRSKKQNNFTHLTDSNVSSAQKFKSTRTIKDEAWNQSKVSLVTKI